MGNDDEDSIVVDLITGSQGSLYAYILSLLYRQQDSHDVLQETNMVLWKKRCEAPKSDEFIAWACRVAFYQVLAYRKRHLRDRLFFSEELLADLSDPATQGASTLDYRLQLLNDCIKCLSEKSKLLLRGRYHSSLSVGQIAKHNRKSVAAISQKLYRIRMQLIDCVRRKEVAEANG